MFQNEKKSSNLQEVKKIEEKTREQLGIKINYLTLSRINKTYNVLIT
jgi:hypothetical protein